PLHAAVTVAPSGSLTTKSFTPPGGFGCAASALAASAAAADISAWARTEGLSARAASAAVCGAFSGGFFGSAEGGGTGFGFFADINPGAAFRRGTSTCAGGATGATT